MKAKALFISDEPETARVWGSAINQAGLEISIQAASGPALETFADDPPDIIIIEDLCSNGELKLLEKLRDETAVPILCLTHHTDELFLLKTYRAGADEVIPFPITPRLFEEKVKAWMRRIASVPLAVLDEVEAGCFRLNPGSKWLKINSGNLIRLTSLESRLLYVLMSHPGRTIDTSQLIERIWGYYGDGDCTALKNLVYRLRRKIETDPRQPCRLVTDNDHGYRFIVG